MEAKEIEKVPSDATKAKKTSIPKDNDAIATDNHSTDPTSNGNGQVENHKDQLSTEPTPDKNDKVSALTPEDKRRTSTDSDTNKVIYYILKPFSHLKLSLHNIYPVYILKTENTTLI